MTRTAHLFTVDVEEYFQVSAFAGAVSPDEWTRFPSRVECSTRILLDHLEAFDVLGTFFVLGWVADRQPDLVRAISTAGHEIATHGYWHRRVCALSPEEFRLDVRRSKEVLEDLTGRPVHGHRAPSFSIVPGSEWAFDVLLEEGFRYDSSLFPIRRNGYGYPNACSEVHLIRRESGTLLELPLATIARAGIRIPGAGGAYLRLLPFALTRQTLLDHSRRGRPAVFYVHPWELDPDQPRLRVSLHTRFRHYGGLRRMLGRVKTLLAEFPFTSVECLFGYESPAFRYSSLPTIAYG